MQHLWTIATAPEHDNVAENTNYAISPLLVPGSNDNDESGAVRYGIAMATSVSVALAF